MRLRPASALARHALPALAVATLAACSPVAVESLPYDDVTVVHAVDAGDAFTFLCVAPLSECSLACVDLSRDPAHCGTCDLRCATGESCSGARCRASADAACTPSDATPCPSGDR